MVFKYTDDNIIINDVGKENMEYITNEILSELINLYGNDEKKFIVELFKLIHCNTNHKENMNMHIASKTNTTYMKSKENDEWRVKETRRYLREYIISLLNFVKEKLDDNGKNIINKILKSFENSDDDNNNVSFELFGILVPNKFVKPILRQIILLLLDNHKIIMENKLKYVKQQKDLEYINKILKQKKII